MRRGGAEEAAPLCPPPREVEGRRRITLVFFSYLSSDFIQPCRGRSGERHASSFLVYFTLSRSIRLSAWHRRYSHLHNRRVTNERFLAVKTHTLRRDNQI